MHRADDLRHHERTTRLVLVALALCVVLGGIGAVWMVCQEMVLGVDWAND